MANSSAGSQRVDPIDTFVKNTIQQYRSKLLDLSSRNPLINFRHSDRSRSHIRIVDEIPEILYGKLEAGRQLTLVALPDPDLVPRDEQLPMFEAALKRAKREDEAYRAAVAELPPNASDRKKQKIERELRNRVRVILGLSPYAPATDVRARAAELGISTEHDLARNNGQRDRRYNDLKVQTLFFRDDLDRKLSGLSNSARVLLQDAGLSALYCALGFLEYYESEASDEKRVAPLVFFPVDLDRELDRGEYRYFLRTRNEDVEVNVALTELLRQQYSIELPQWVEPEDDSPPLEKYFRKVERLIQGRQDWKLRRYVTVGLFTFTTLAMYKDLDPERWSEHPIEKCEVLRTLIAGAEMHGNQFAEEYDIDSTATPEPLLITDADSSQHSAVVDVLKGQNCVIQGPPGTGKSQTITNIISAALYAGKSVMFVAEKMAALDVVKKRLDAAGLDRFCLELHSSKTAKSAVIGSLARRLEYRGPRLSPLELQSNADALQRARKELIYYVEKANEPAGVTGLRVCDVLLGSAKRDPYRKQLPAQIAKAKFNDPLRMMSHVWKEMLDAASNLQEYASRVTANAPLKDHPWRGIQSCSLTDFQIESLISELENWVGAAESAHSRTNEFLSRVGLEVGSTQRALRDLCASVVQIPSPGARADGELYPLLRSTATRQRLGAVLAMLTDISEIAAQITRQFSFDAEVTLASDADIIAKSAETLSDLGLLGTIPINTLTSTLASRQKRREIVESAREPFGAILRSFGVATEELAAARAAVFAMNHLTALSRDKWHLRTRELLDTQNLGILQTGAAVCDGLVRRRAKLSEQVDLAALPDSRELRRLSFELKTANFITALFKRDCRYARKLVRAVSKSPTRRTRLERADLLVTCAQYLEDKAKCDNDPQLRAACGAHFRGIDTQFDELLQIQAWAARVNTELAKHPKWGPTLKQFAFTAPAASLDTVLGCTNPEGYEAVLRLLKEFQADGDDILSAIQQRETDRWAALQKTIENLKAASIRNDIATCSIVNLATLLKTRKQRVQDLEGELEHLQLAGGSLPTAATQIDVLRETLAYAENTSALKFSEKFISELFQSLDRLSELKREAAEILNGPLAEVSNVVERVSAIAELSPILWCGVADLEQADLVDLVQRCRRAIEHREELQDYLSFLLAEDTARDASLGPILSAFAAADEDHRLLREATEMVFYRSAAEQLMDSDPRLKRHSGSSHDHLRAQFQQLDRECLLIRRKLLASDLVNRSIPAGNFVGRVADLTDLALVQHLSGQTRPRVPLRDLFRRAGNAIKALMPCWMMSPMSVAQFLEHGALEFDLVVMDEASQIRPEEALGAVARGKQLVVVGDQMQLPPTPFFQKLSADGSADDEDENFVDIRQESILEAAAARFYPPRRLKWHYRSRHGSLIAFSNHEFYNDELIVFPSPHHDDTDYGVKYVQVEGIYSAGTNTLEAKFVVEYAVNFMREHTDRSLGIVAVNSKQAELIREELDRVFASDPAAEAYRAKWANDIEAVFVKNLENVQGDERDVVFISTVYGKDAVGNFYQRFGPINSEYGHRRLNVLFTRAKSKVVVFTSMVPEEIEDEGKKWGVRALKGYLQYARDGHWNLPNADHSGECESEFEQWVLEVLRTNGYDAVPQLGFAGYRLDIAVRNPTSPGTFLCGIECDGASYHSAKSVRERDRLRQEVLERLGWKIYRIWSTDWFRNPATQTHNLLAFLNRLSSGS